MIMQKPENWPEQWFPDWISLSDDQRIRFVQLLKRLPKKWQPPRALRRRGILRDPRQWETLEIELGGDQLKGAGRAVLVTRWQWELLTCAIPGVSLLAHSDNKPTFDGKPRYYAVPSHAVITRWLRSQGRSSNAVTLAPMLLAVAGLSNYNSRSKLLDKSDPFNLTIFNLALDPFPASRDGDDWRRSRLSARCARYLVSLCGSVGPTRLEQERERTRGKSAGLSKKEGAAIGRALREAIGLPVNNNLGAVNDNDPPLKKQRRRHEEE